MATTVSFNNSSYSIPAVGNRSWGASVTNFLIAVAGNALSKSGGNFTLTADVNFGANYGLIAKYVKSVSSNIAQSGVVRLANNEGIAWRNAANGADKTLKVDASDKLAFGASAVSETELGYLSGVTSTIQTQIDSKQATISAGTTADYYRGDKTFQDLATAVAATAAVTANTAKVSADGSISTHNDVDTAGAVAGDVLTYDGTDWVPGTAATGSGKNYITNPSASGDTSDWSAIGTATLSRTTTAAELPRANTTGTAFKVVTLAADDGASFDFTLDDADERAANLLVKLAAIVADASTWKVQLYAYSDSARTADETEITLVDADSNGDWFLAATTADFTTFWTPNPSLPYMQLRIVDTVGGNTLYFSDTLVGPGSATSGAVDEYLGTFATVSNLTTNIEVQQGHYWRVGDRMKVDAGFELSGANTETFVSPVLPDSKTVDTSKLLTGLTGASDRVRVGGWFLRDISTGFTHSGSVIYDIGAATFYLAFSDGGNDLVEPFSNSPITFADGDVITWQFEVPIAGWESNVGLGTNRVEYAYNSDTSDATDTTDFAYGPGGVVFGSFTASRTKVVRFQSPVQPTDVLRFQVQLGGSGKWYDLAEVANYVCPYSEQNGISYGVRFRDYAAGNTSTDVEVIFGTYRVANGASWGAAGSAWSNIATSKWRVVKHSAGVVTGYGLAGESRSGLVNSFAGQSQDLESGTYTPTLTGTTNVAATTAFQCQYMRVGKCVTVSGIFNLDPSSSTSGTATTLTVSVPSHLPASSDASTPVGGTAANVFGDVLAIDSVASSTVVRFRGTPQNVGNNTYTFMFMYRMA